MKIMVLDMDNRCGDDQGGNGGDDGGGTMDDIM